MTFWETENKLGEKKGKLTLGGQLDLNIGSKERGKFAS